MSCLHRGQRRLRITPRTIAARDVVVAREKPCDLSHLSNPRAVCWRHRGKVDTAEVSLLRRLLPPVSAICALGGRDRQLTCRDYRKCATHVRFSHYCRRSRTLLRGDVFNELATYPEEVFDRGLARPAAIHS